MILLHTFEIMCTENDYCYNYDGNYANVIAVLTFSFFIMIDHHHFFQFEVQPPH